PKQRALARYPGEYDRPAQAATQSQAVRRLPRGRRYPLAPRPSRSANRREGRMRHSTDHILTSHAGSLPRPDALIEANRAHDAGEIGEPEFRGVLAAAVNDVVRRQHELGIDVPGDGEFGK